MVQLGSHLWIFAGSTVPFFTLPYTTRMTVVKLADGTLWVHSPVQLTANIKQQIDALGSVKYLIAPNALHHLFMADWAVAYPDAQLYGTQQVIDKRSDIAFSETLSTTFVAPWAKEIDGFCLPAQKSCRNMCFSIARQAV